MTKNKLAPYSVASEKLVIGSLLREPGLLDDVRAIIPEADAFFRDDYGALYLAIREACTAHPGTDTAALIEALVAGGAVKGDDAARTLRELAGFGQPPAGARLHAKVIAEKARRRRFIAVVCDIVHEAYYSEEPTDTIAQRAGERLSAIGPRPAAEGGIAAGQRGLAAR